MKSGLIAVADQVVVSGVNFLAMVIAGRTMGVHDFAVFSLSMAAFFFLATLHRAGCTQAMNIFGATEAPAEQDARLRGVLRAHAVALPFVGLLLVIASVAFDADMALLCTATAGFCAYAVQETLRRFAYTQGRNGSALKADAVSYGGQLLLVGLLAASGELSPVTAFAALACGALVSFLAAYVPIRRRLAKAPAGPAFEPPQRALVAWLLLTAVAAWGASQAYPFFLTTLSAGAVAAFLACRTIVNALNLLMQGVNNHLPGRLRRLWLDGEAEAFRADMLRTCALACASGIGFVVVMHWIAEPLLHGVYDGAYDHAADVLRVLSLGMVWMLLGVVLGAYSLAMGDSQAGFFANIGATLVTFSIGIQCVRNFGIIGAAWATTLSLAAATTLQFVLVIRRFRSRSRQFARP